ncbi:MAG: cellulase family glycosylhydrolase, partial [Anaerolineales bacterium]
MSRPQRTRNLLKRIATCLLPLALCLASAAWLLRAPIRTYLGSVTGEENSWEQIKGLGRLIVLRLTRPPLQLEPYMPIAHAGVNPFGINTFLEQEVEAWKVEKAMRMIWEAGFRWIRQEFPWEDIEQNARGDFWDHRWNISGWEKYDRIVELADNYGLQIIARLGNPPAWSRADGNARGSFAPPDDFEDFGNFVHAIVSRYKGKVKYYQIWNEPNIYPEWGEQPADAAAYVRLLQIAYRRAKEADPDCVILSAGLAQTIETGPMNLSDLTYLQQMYDAGAKGYFDIMGVMAYGLWTGPGDHRASPELTNFSRPQLIRDIMVRNGDAEKPLWATEVGWNAVPPDFPEFPMFGRVTEEQQARYAVQAYQRAQQEWPWMGVLNYWFFKRATDTEMDQVFYYFRIAEPDFAPLPAYEAMKQYADAPPQVHLGYHQEDHWALQWEGRWEDI